jgi:hypothetical protein
VSSIDEASGAVGGNVEQARELATGIAASKETIDSLAGALASLGLEAKASEANAASENAEALNGQANGLADALDALRSQIEALRGLLASAGGVSGSPAPTKPSTPTPPSSQPDTASGSGPSSHDVTKPSLPPDPARRPRGEPADVKSVGGDAIDVERENKAAKVLAEAGYDIEQGPRERPNGKKPDYMIDGEWWDCYAPRGTSTRTIHTQIRRKVGKSDADRQADRIILNLDGCGATIGEIRARLERSPIRGLKEIKIVKGGRVTQFFPWDTEAEYDGN